MPGEDDCCCLVCVRTQEVGVVEDLGQFKRLLDPGLHCVKWPLEGVVGRMSLRIQQLDVLCETKTKDNVFVQVGVAVQYRVLLQSAYDAYYRLTDPRNQIQSYVFDVVRSTVPKMELDEAFTSKDEVASAVLNQLRDVMKNYGYEIKQTLVTDLSPDARVKASMNEINASRRLKEAASHKAEADKIKQVKAAEAEAEARYLSGLGVARQRKAIVQGLKESVGAFSSDVEGARPKDVMDILLLSQYFDTLSAVGANSMIMEHDPATVATLRQSVGRAFLTGVKNTHGAEEAKIYPDSLPLEPEDSSFYQIVEL
eukprot:CAMPEP_0117034304 /NCGR_PEP_ID=MMETSP0472-20121206/24436_1 /TAXON_ID=693140 ORGANISM="Tiarina fusus, Strain LIS" /NCGR_SAMPLE_ID=MMETSP0472 /ASSEMBLY_ACC=CAM_ASM_000603 /LENGTH=311 /DNA_ID=CAMNT_0004743443 /DNA_START=158 /DNA_END=1094 /DNA_ORIENTATION=-